jgi:lipopolysaccharide assembly outer membrane protein LptD (OstA)
MLSYEFLTKKKEEFEVPKRFLELGENYEKDVGGVDFGFDGLLYVSNYVFLIFYGKKKKTLIGFILGSNPQIDREKGEKKVFLPLAIYIEPKFRKSGGKYKQIADFVIKALIRRLEARKFDHLQIVSRVPQLTGQSFTDEGYKRFLIPLVQFIKEESKRRKKEGLPGRYDKSTASFYFNKK